MEFRSHGGFGLQAGRDRAGRGIDRPGLADQPTGDLLRELLDQSQRLVKQEVRLARLELRDEVKGYARGGTLMGSAAAVGMGAFLVLCFAAVFALALAMPGWAAALIVGGALAVIAAGLYFAGKGKVRRTQLAPQQSLGSIREDQRWARETMHRARSQRHASA